MLKNRQDVQTEALAELEKHHRCTAVLGTGVGKTLVGLTHMDRNTSPMDKVLVVAPKKAIFKSWQDDAVKFDKEYLLGRIVFTTYLSINKHDPKDYQVVYRVVSGFLLWCDRLPGYYVYRITRNRLLSACAKSVRSADRTDIHQHVRQRIDCINCTRVFST